MTKQIDNSSSILKGLETKYKFAKDEIEILDNELKSAKIKITTLNEQKKNAEKALKDISNQIEELKRKAVKENKLVVSEHAILRYLERMNIINIEEIKKKLLTDGVLDAYKAFGQGKFPHPYGKCVVKDGIMVTFEN